MVDASSNEGPDGEPLNLVMRLDAEQNEVIRQLDELNAKVEQLLQDCSHARIADAA